MTIRQVTYLSVTSFETYQATIIKANADQCDFFRKKSSYNKAGNRSVLFLSKKNPECINGQKGRHQISVHFSKHIKWQQSRLGVISL